MKDFSERKREVLGDHTSVINEDVVHIPFSNTTNTPKKNRNTMKEAVAIKEEDHGKENSPIHSCLFGEPVSPKCKLSLNVTLPNKPIKEEIDDDNNNTEPSAPLTPTANLKMLISAVSPEIRNRDRETKRKELFKKIEEEVDNEILSKSKPKTIHILPKPREKDDVSGEPTEDTDDFMSSQESEKGTGSRKEKSLGLLCQRFLSKYPEYPPPAETIPICLDEVAKELKVERRRIYDIVNVLESVEMVSRVAKNKYTWHGKRNLHTTLAKLKALGEAEGFGEKIEQLKMYECCRETKQTSEKENPEDLLPLKSYVRKDKSLGIMSQRFLMLFLVSKPKTVNLDISAKILIGDPNVDKTENAKFKTKIRRLYDIANILTSLDLIRKVHVTEIRGRKPAFKYIGPDVDNVHGMNAAMNDGSHRPNSRHSMLHSVQAKGEDQAVLDIMNSYRPLLPSETRLSQNIHLLQQGISNSKDKISLLKNEGKKSFVRHASFDQICKVAEKERIKLFSNSQPSSPVKELNFDDVEDEKPLPRDAVSLNQVSLLKGQKRVIFMHGKNQCQLIANSSSSDSPPAPQVKVETNTTNVSVNPSIPSANGAKSTTLVHLTRDQIDAVLRSLKVPVPLANELKTTDASTQSTPPMTSAAASALLKLHADRDSNASPVCTLENSKKMAAVTPQAGSSIMKPMDNSLITPSEAKTSSAIPKPIRRTNSDPGASQHGDETPKCPATGDKEVEAISRQVLKRRLSDGQKAPLRALHLQTEFRDSPPLSKLPKLSPEAMTKDLAGDLDLASPLPDEDDTNKPNFSLAKSLLFTKPSSSPKSSTHLITPTSTCISKSAVKVPIVTQPFIGSQSVRSPMPFNSTMIPVSPMSSKQFTHPMHVFQGVQITPNGQFNGHPVNVVLPITFTPPHTPTADGRLPQTVFAFPTASPNNITTLSAIQQTVPGKLLSSGAKSVIKTTPVNSVLGSSIVTPGSTPGSSGPNIRGSKVVVTPKVFTGNIPKAAVRNLTSQLKSPEGVNPYKLLRQNSQEGGSSTARKLDMLKNQS